MLYYVYTKEKGKIMSVKTRAAARLVKHLAFIVAVMVLVYLVFLSIPLDTFFMILGGLGVVFFSYQLFRIYVTMEEMSENRKK
jgi:hypothetical protein